MSDELEPREWCVVFDAMQGSSRVLASDESAIDAAVSRWIDSRKTHDTLLDLTSVGGASYKMLASTVIGWMLSTPAAREKDAAFERAFKAERAANGWVEEET